MTITLTVQAVLKNPEPFGDTFRLSGSGRLLLSDDAFRIYQLSDDMLTQTPSMRIVDSQAATQLKRLLPKDELGRYYFGKAVLEIWTHKVAEEWVLHETVSVWLQDIDGEEQTFVKIRPHPWGWAAND